MNVDGTHYRSIWLDGDGGTVRIVDQTRLPHAFEVAPLRSLEETAVAIEAMRVRGAPLIGATAAYGLALALAEDPGDDALHRARRRLLATRPTAVNLRWALERMARAVAALQPGDRAEAAFAEAARIADEDVEANRRIGEHGVALIRAASEDRGGDPVRVLTHCNAGWLATVDWGTATAPIYRAHDEGIPVHVWVDETRPRNQGGALTAWELGHHGVPHTVVVDNAGGHLMQRGQVDLCLVGTDRTTANGDVGNKIGTYLKALAARDNGVPFFVAAPSTSIDLTLDSGDAIPIEERSPREVEEVEGRDADGTVRRVRVVADGSPVANPAFDVTPARLVTALITDRGVTPATRAGIRALYPEENE
jgi:methylthioribose-1-phosphate isomerase